MVGADVKRKRSDEPHDRDAEGLGSLLEIAFGHARQERKVRATDHSSKCAGNRAAALAVVENSAYPRTAPIA